uniref:Uncharacterized protein n=1 Tax=Arundo donax TaxID=35708 RepID=A0A0A9FV56_ARUDO
MPPYTGGRATDPTLPYIPGTAPAHTW